MVHKYDTTKIDIVYEKINSFDTEEDYENFADEIIKDKTGKTDITKLPDYLNMIKNSYIESINEEVKSLTKNGEIYHSDTEIKDLKEKFDIESEILSKLNKKQCELSIKYSYFEKLEALMEKEEEFKKKIKLTRNDPEKIDEVMDLWEKEKPKKSDKTIFLMIFLVLSLYLYFFYVSVGNSAFYKNFSEAENISTQNIIFDPSAIREASQTANYFVLILPFLFMALGFLLHKFRHENNWSHFIPTLIFVVFLDITLAYYIVNKQYVARAFFNTGEAIGNIPISFVISELFFFTIIALGVGVVLVWFQALHLYILTLEKEKPEKEARIVREKLQKELAELESDKYNIINKIEDSDEHSRPFTYNKKSIDVKREAIEIERNETSKKKFETKKNIDNIKNDLDKKEENRKVLELDILQSAKENVKPSLIDRLNAFTKPWLTTYLSRFKDDQKDFKEIKLYIEKAFSKASKLYGHKLYYDIH